MATSKRILPTLASFGLAALLGASLAPGCGGTPLAPAPGGEAGSSDTTGTTGAAGAADTTGAAGRPLYVTGDPPTGAAGTFPALTVPDDVGPPIVACDNDPGALLIDLPCQLGMAPVSEVDCGIAGYPDTKIRFMLVPSLPDAINGGQIVVGQPMRFAADLLPFQGPPSEFFNLAPQSITGTVVFTKLDLTNATLDGWFPRLDFVWTPTGPNGPYGTTTCRLDKGRFTAVPGGFL
jgi:hypothetical protein